VDLADRAHCAQAFGALGDATHAVYAAYVEKPNSEGWRDPQQMALNLSMLRNAMDPLLDAAPGFRHVTLLQGTKAYGPPKMAIPIPARERNPRAEHPVFYWLQEDYLREKQRGAAWHWT